jgi:D-sedoheptulose 7-phosphate isomerase
MEKTDQYIDDYLALEQKTLNALDRQEIHDVVSLFLKTYNAGGSIYVFGNGGSASTASHMANDFNKGISEYVDKKFRMVCLNDNVATLMSIANDISYEEVFRFQLRNKLSPDDLVIGISGSGNSGNVINALEYASSQKVKTIAICGFDGGRIKKIADCCFHVKLSNMQVVEDMHLILNHLLMNVIDRELGITNAC